MKLNKNLVICDKIEIQNIKRERKKKTKFYFLN